MTTTGKISVLNTLVSALSLIITLFTYIFARNIFKRYGQQQFLNQQINLVSDLVLKLNTHKIKVKTSTLTSKGGSASIYSLNLFELARCRKSKPGLFEEWLDAPVFFEIGSNQIFDLNTYINNPFLPKSIADRLLDFSPNYYNILNKNSLYEKTKIVFLETNISYPEDYNTSNTLEPSILNQGNSVAFYTWMSTIECAIQLEKCINDWINFHKINNLNIRI